MTQPRQLVLAGAGHAHLTTLKHLRRFTERGHGVTVINKEDHHYYSGMGPGMLSGIYKPEEIRIHVKKMVEDRGGRFIRDEVVRIDPHGKRILLKEGGEVPYQVASFNLGSGIPVDEALQAGAESFYPVKPIRNLLPAREEILERLRGGPLELAVCGGGAAGTEITGNLLRLVHRAGGRANIRLITGERLMAEAPDGVRKRALAFFQKRGVRVMEGVLMKRIAQERLHLSDGSRLRCHLAFLALGVKPPAVFRTSGLPTGPDGGLRVNPHLQSDAHPELFGGGDCIHFTPRPLAKVGVFAVRQNPILMENLLSALEGRSLKRFSPQPAYMLILNLGDGTGILYWKSLVFRGRLAFWLKDHIDRKFIRSFQVSGERRASRDA